MQIKRAYLSFRAAAQQNGDIRLVESTGFHRGRLEVFTGGAWGTICLDDSKDQAGFAQVACRQLGFVDFKQVGKVDTLG